MIKDPDFKKGKIAFVADTGSYYVGTDLTAEPGTVWIDKDGNVTSEIPAGSGGGQPPQPQAYFVAVCKTSSGCRNN